MFSSADSGATLDLDAASGKVAFVQPWIRVTRFDACNLFAVRSTHGTSGSSVITFFAVFNEAIATDGLLLAARGASRATRWSIIAVLTSFNDPVPAKWF
jgi:hypothetical protein